MEVANIYVQEGLNQDFNITENCDIISAPYDTFIDTGRYFLTKRFGIDELVTIGGRVHDFGYYQDTDKQEKISLLSSFNRLITFNDTTTNTIKSSLGDDCAIGKIVAGGKVEVEKGTVTSGTATTLTDAVQSWDTNEFAGYYVWISDGTGVGQIKQIQANTSDTLTVNGWLGGVAVDNTSNYSIYTQLVTTTLLSDNTNSRLWYYNGEAVVEVLSLVNFDKIIFFDNRMWSIDNNNKRILWVSEIGDYLVNETFVDSGVGYIVDVFVLGAYLLLFKEDSIFAVSKYTDSSGNILYNVSELVSNVGIYGKGGVGMYSSSCYFLGSDKQIYNIQITSDGIKLIGNLIVVGKALKNYLSFLPDTQECSFIVGDNEFEIITGTKGFKYRDYLKSWTFNEYGVPITKVKRLFGSYYYGEATRIGRKSTTVKTDFTTSYVQAIGFMFGISNIFSIKKISSLTWLFGYNSNETIDGNLEISTYTSHRKGEVKSNIKQSDTSTPTGSYKLLGDSLLAETLLGSGNIETSTSLLFILKKIINRSGFFFQIKLTSNTVNGFDVGEIGVLFKTTNQTTFPKVTTL